MTSRQKIQYGVWAMVLAIIGDYLLGFGTIGMNGGPDTYMGVTWNTAPDWRYAVSSLLGFACAPLFAVGAAELFRVMERKYSLSGSRLYKIFKLGNWGGILYFAFIHIGICMLPVVFNAGMAATGDVPASADMTFRVLKSITVPLILGFLICDGCATAGWIGMVLKGMLPVKKAAVLCNPLCTVLLGQLLNLIAEGLDSGTESLGWLLMYLICSLKLVSKNERMRDQK